MIRIQESRDYARDVMLCWKERCDFCRESNPEEPTAEDEEERTLEIDPTESPYRGLPFLHYKDIKFSVAKGGLVLDPAKPGKNDQQMALLEENQETEEVEGVLFKDSFLEFFSRCLSCVSDRCEVCIKARAKTRTWKPTSKKAQEDGDGGGEGDGSAVKKRKTEGEERQDGPEEDEEEQETPTKKRAKEKQPKEKPAKEKQPKGKHPKPKSSSGRK